MYVDIVKGTTDHVFESCQIPFTSFNKAYFKPMILEIASHESFPRAQYRVDALSRFDIPYDQFKDNDTIRLFHDLFRTKNYQSYSVDAAPFEACESLITSILQFGQSEYSTLRRVKDGMHPLACDQKIFTIPILSMYVVCTTLSN